MTIKPIRNDDDLQAAFQRLESIFQAPEGTPEADEMEVLVTLIEAYENKHYPIGPADPVEAIKFRMEQQGLTPRDLEKYIGSSGRVSEVLNRKRALSLSMIVRLHQGLRIPYESLLPDEVEPVGSSRPGGPEAAQFTEDLLSSVREMATSLKQQGLPRKAERVAASQRK